VLAILGLSPVSNEVMTPAGFFAAIALLIGYIAYAKRRTTALVKEEAQQTRQEAERAFEELNARSALTTGVTLRWRARTYVLLVIVLVAAGAAAAGAWSKHSWFLLALFGLAFASAAKVLLARLAEPEVLHVGSTGIEDKIRFGLIPWRDVESVLLHEYEIKGTKVANLSIGVRDPAAYSQRLGPVARFWHRADSLGLSDDIRIPVHILDMAPFVLFRLIRAFHERALPAGAISGKDNYYRVDLEAGKLEKIMAELKRTFAESPSASGAPTKRQKELIARMDDLMKADIERMSNTHARAEKTIRTTSVAIVIGLLIALLVSAGVFNR
jgi:hypothetical protein